jgi:hypothetical protein
LLPSRDRGESIWIIKTKLETKQLQLRTTTKQPQQETLSKDHHQLSQLQKKINAKNMKIISVLFSALFLSTASCTNLNLRGGSTRGLEGLDSDELLQMEQNALDFFAEVGIDLDAPPLDDAQLEQLIEAHADLVTGEDGDYTDDENVGALLHSVLRSAIVDVSIFTVTRGTRRELYIEVRRHSGQYWRGTASLAAGSSAISGEMLDGTMDFPQWSVLRKQTSLEIGLTTKNMAGNFNGAGTFAASGSCSGRAFGTLRGFWME